MQIGNTEFEFNPRARHWVGTGLRYTGYGILLAVGGTISATILLNEYLGKALSWVKLELDCMASNLINRDFRETIYCEGSLGGESESQEVSQTRIDEESESEHQAGSDYKPDEVPQSTEPTTIGDLIAKQIADSKNYTDDKIPFGNEVTDCSDHELSSPDDEAMPTVSEGVSEEKLLKDADFSNN